MNSATTIQNLFKPRSIAIVGASRHPEKVGYQLLHNLILSGYPGNLYPINPNAKQILNYRSFPTLSSLTKVPDLVIIATPAPLVKTILSEAILLKVKSVIIITAGFAESSPAGKQLQIELKNLLAGSSTRLLGPNCLGVLSTIYQLNATFGPKLPTKGNVMLISQSGALVTGILDWLKTNHLGLSHALTLGNRLDISETEALAFALKDPHTKYILIYLESFANPTAFFHLASKHSGQKTILLLKGGSTSAGATASQSHTAALSTDQVLVRAMCSQSGVVLADTIESWLATATFFIHSPKFKGQSLAIITNAGGPGVLLTDALINHQLPLISPSPLTVKHLRHQLPQINPHNPLDILGDATPDRFQTSIRLIAQDRRYHGLILIITPQTSTNPTQVAKAITDQAKHIHKPIMVILLGGHLLTTCRQLLTASKLPVFTYPDDALNAISLKLKADLQSHPTVIRLQPQKVLPPGTYLQPNLDQSLHLLKRYGLSVPKFRLLDSLSLLASALNYVGRPAVMKTASMTLAHKAKAKGVYLDVMTNIQGQQYFRRLQNIHPQVWVQQTVHSSLEIIIGFSRHPQWGPYLTVGLGGSLTNLLADRGYIFLPTSHSYLLSVLKTTKAYQAIIELGFQPQLLISCIKKLIRLFHQNTWIAELEINPAMYTQNHLFLVDVKITPIHTQPI